MSAAVGTILFAVAASAILCAASALEQTPAPVQHIAPTTQGIVTPVQRLPVPPVQETSSSDLIAKPAPERTIGEANHEPQTNILATGSLPRDLSPWGMFRNAVLTVKIVMVGLAIASVATWTVALAKTIELWKARRLAGRGLEILAISLRAAEAEIAQVPSPVARFAAAAVEEVKRSDGLDSEGIKDRASILLSRIEAQAGRTIIRGICKPRPQGLPLAG